MNDVGSVHWMCWPKFDSSFLFGRLLDEENGGDFQIRPDGDDFKSSQSYLPNTNILTTDFLAGDGAFRVTDFAPRFQTGGRYARPVMLCRKVEPLSGNPKIRVHCRPKGDYGKITPQSSIEDHCLVYSGLEKIVRLYSDMPLGAIQDAQPILLNKPIYFILSWSNPIEESLKEIWENYFDYTRSYWEQWVFRTSIGPFYQAQVIRSALALKLHQYEDTGAIIAASTTSLPESNGSGRTWDYRYCWMRDAFYTLRALNSIGHFDELVGYANYIQNIAVSKTGGYQPLYGISANAELVEQILDLPGYLGNQPVRVGNQAYEHVQNDVYGQILVSLLPLYVDERFTQHGFSVPSLRILKDVLHQIKARMNEPDAGLWEFRNKVQKFCYTYLFHWAGAHAALRIAKKFEDHDLADLAQGIIIEAKEEIEKCYRPELGAYAVSQESSWMDASLFHLVTMNYLDGHSEKAKSQVDFLAKKLAVGETGLFFRYKQEDDFGKPESAFLICGFWYVEALAVVGRIAEAISTFEQLLKYTNHLGLLSEDVDPETGSQWGNFPQTYSHVGLMAAAFRISQKLDKPLFL